MANAIHPLSGADYILEQQLKAASEVAASGAVATAVTAADIPGKVTTAVTAADITGKVTTAVTAADIPGEVTTAVAAAITTSGIPVVFTGATDPTGMKVGDMWVKVDTSIHIYDGTAWKQAVAAS